MSAAASAISAILPVAAELLPKLYEALAAGNRREAKQLAEEIARRQAFELLQIAKSKALKKK